MTDFATRLEAEMDRLGLNQTEAGDRIGVSPNTVHCWLKKGVIPTGARLVALARVIGVTEHYLLNGGGKTSTTYECASVMLPLVSLKAKRRIGEYDVLRSDLDGIEPEQFYVARQNSDREGVKFRRTHFLVRRQCETGSVYIEHYGVWATAKSGPRDAVIKSYCDYD